MHTKVIKLEGDLYEKFRNNNGMNSIPRVSKIYSGKKMFMAHVAVTGKSSTFDQNCVIFPQANLNFSESKEIYSSNIADIMEVSRRKQREFLPHFRNTVDSGKITAQHAPIMATSALVEDFSIHGNSIKISFSEYSLPLVLSFM